LQESYFAQQCGICSTAKACGTSVHHIFSLNAVFGTLFSIEVEENRVENYKIDVMKQVLQRLVAKDETHEKFHLSTTIFMILLFLTFWGVSFYVLVNSLA
jgi:hypothetical protein